MEFKVLEVIYQHEEITKVKIKKEIYNGTAIEYLHYKGNYTFKRHEVYIAEVIGNELNGNEIGIKNIRKIGYNKLIKRLNKKFKLNIDSGYMYFIRGEVSKLNIDEHTKSEILKEAEYMIEEDRTESLLNSYGMTQKESSNISSRIVEKYGLNTYNTILEKPYVLFEYTDKFEVIEELSKKEEELKCIFLVLKYMYKNGHTFATKHDLKELKYGTKELNYSISKNIDTYLENLHNSGVALIKNDRVYIKRYYDIEDELEDMIRARVGIKDKKIISKIDEFLKLDNSEIKSFNEEQLIAIKQSAINYISVITGGAGVGKTTTIYYGIIKLFKYLNPNAKIQIVGFTGKSVSKIKNESIPSETIHRFLNLSADYKYINDNREEDINLDLLIIEEGGMVDMDLYYQLFKRVSQDTKIVIIGDYNQNESIGFGQVFKALVDSNLIHKTELFKVYRQKNKSNIILNSNKIIQGKTTDDKVDPLIINNTDFVMKNCKSDKILDKVKKEVRQLLNKGHSIDDIVILSPYKKKMNGSYELNYEISKVIKEDRKYKFECMDKVIQNTNNYHKGIYNGQQGVVGSIEIELENLIKVDVIYNGEIVEYEGDEIKEIELSYSLTVHKMQGDECKIVIFVVDEKHKEHLNRNLIYTAVTRAMEQVIIIGNEEIFNECIKKLPPKKNTTLLDRLCRLEEIELIS